MGAYLCIAKNEVPPAVSKRVNLKVNCEYSKTIYMTRFSRRHFEIARLKSIDIGQVRLSNLIFIFIFKPTRDNTTSEM